MHVDVDPPRVGFERRAIGMVHWAEFVYAPNGKLEAELSGEHSSIFGWTPLGCEHLWGNWYIVWAIK